MTQLPEVFLDRLRRIAGNDWPAVAARLVAGEAQQAVGFRVNRLRAGADAVIWELKKLGIPSDPIIGIPDGFVVPGKFRHALTHSPPAEARTIYIQDPASMLAALVLAPQPGDEVLDLAAAPGGKTLHMAGLMQNRGRIAAVEVIRGRMYRLQANVRSSGATIVDFYITDGRTVGRKTPERFDRVLLDAPCSCEARFRAEQPSTWQQWSLRKICESARKQKGLLRAAIQAARPGGQILYSTCAFAPEENEAVVDHVLREFGEHVTVELVSLPLPNLRPGMTRWEGAEFLPAVEKAVRVIPNDRMHGFFLCLLRKTDQTVHDGLLHRSSRGNKGRSRCGGRGRRRA